jgi:type IV pilus assembly protein PilA
MMSSKRGLTIIELLIVVAIIGMLAAVLFPSILTARQRAADTASGVYTRNVSQWVMSAFIMNPALRVTDLPVNCNDPLYTAEGAAAQIPSIVQSCEVLIEPNGPGTFGVRVISITSREFEYTF